MKTQFHRLKVKSEFWIKFIWSQTFKEHSEGSVKTINLCLLVSKSSGNKFQTMLFS